MHVGRDRRGVTEKNWQEWQEALDRKGLKLNASKSEVMACTRECRVEADISDNENMKVVDTER